MISTTIFADALRTLPPPKRLRRNSAGAAYEWALHFIAGDDGRRFSFPSIRSNYTANIERF